MSFLIYSGIYLQGLVDIFVFIVILYSMNNGLHRKKFADSNEALRHLEELGIGNVGKENFGRWGK